MATSQTTSTSYVQRAGKIIITDAKGNIVHKMPAKKGMIIEVKEAPRKVNIPKHIKDKIAKESEHLKLLRHQESLRIPIVDL